MGTNIVQMTDGAGNIQYPKTNSDAVGMMDGSGNLTTYLNKRITELNISNLYPTQGIGGSNKYDLATAITQVPAEYRVQGVKVSFVNEGGDNESWEFKGGSWAVGSFSEVGARKFSEIESKTTYGSISVKLILIDGKRWSTVNGNLEVSSVFSGTRKLFLYKGDKLEIKTYDNSTISNPFLLKWDSNGDYIGFEATKILTADSDMYIALDFELSKFSIENIYLSIESLFMQNIETQVSAISKKNDNNENSINDLYNIAIDTSEIVTDGDLKGHYDGVLNANGSINTASPSYSRYEYGLDKISKIVINQSTYIGSFIYKYAIYDKGESIVKSEVGPNAAPGETTIEIQPDYAKIIINSVKAEGADLTATFYTKAKMLKKDEELYNRIATVENTVTELENVVEELKGNSGISNNLNGKRIIVDGDSIMRATWEDDGWIKIVAEKNNMTYVNNAVSGTRLTIQEGSSNSILERLKSQSTTYDYVIVGGGFNDLDLVAKEKIGEITDHYDGGYDTSTFVGAMEEMCHYFLNTLSLKKFGFILYYKYNDNWEILSTKARDVLEKWSVPYIDLSKSSGILMNNAFSRSIFGRKFYPYLTTRAYKKGEQVYYYDGYVYTAKEDTIKGSFDISIWEKEPDYSKYFKANRDVFSVNKQYNTGSEVWYDGYLYTANSQISEGVFDESNWIKGSAIELQVTPDSMHLGKDTYQKIATAIGSWLNGL